MDTNDHKRSQPSQQKPATSQQSRTCWTFARGCKACAAICCDCNLWKPKMQFAEKIFCPPKKWAKQKTKKNNDFRKVIISDQIPDALRDLHASKYNRPRNKPNDGCLWKPVKCRSVRASKQLQFVAITETFNENQALGLRHWKKVFEVNWKWTNTFH